MRAAAPQYAIVFCLGMMAGAALIWRLQFGPIYVSGPARVIDGDSIAVAGRNIRLVGIDAPEMPTREGKKCRKLLSRPECIQGSAVALYWRVGGEHVRCWITGSDALTAVGELGRPLGVCFHGETELNAWLLRSCHADLPDDMAHHVFRYRGIVAERRCPQSDAPVAGL